MRAKRLAAVVAMCVCLAAPALASTWTGGFGNWNTASDWDAGVPNGTAAFIGTGVAHTITLDTDVPDITTLDVAWFNTLNIAPGADLTASGEASVAGGENDWGSVAQSGGVVSLASNLTVGSAAGDVAKWAMTADSTLAVGVNLNLGGDGQGSFELGDASTLTVGGTIELGGGGSSMIVSGGTLGQLAGGGDPAILADLNVAGGTFAVEGSAPTINVASYTQVSGGSLSIELDNGGIASINVSGDMALSGGLTVGIASGSVVPAGIYDIIVADGTRTGHFHATSLPDGVALRYEDDGPGSVAKLYVGVEPPALPGIPVGDADFNNPSNLNTIDGVINWASWDEVLLYGDGPERIAQRADGMQYEGAYAAEVRYDGTALEQTLSEVIGTAAYTLSVYADSRDHGYSTHVGIALYADDGGTKTTIDFLEQWVANLVDPAGQDYELLTLEADSAELAPYIGQNLGIRLYTVEHAEPALFDLVIVEKAGAVGSEVPEPAGLGLLGLALLAVRRKRQ